MKKPAKTSVFKGLGWRKSTPYGTEGCWFESSGVYSLHRVCGLVKAAEDDESGARDSATIVLRGEQGSKREKPDGENFSDLFPGAPLASSMERS